MLPATLPHGDQLDRLPTVLIVEDEFVVRMGLADYLQEGGFRVLETVTADEALESVRSGSAPIDIVVTDVRTPGKMDGFMLAQWIRLNRPDLPVIVLSGEAVEGRLGGAFLAGEAVFSKPYDERRLLAKIRQLLARSH
jgi:DNA-binding response OmpR family regulator